MKILVISLAGIGDTLLATPLLRELRRAFPPAEIDVLVLWPGSAQLLEGNPHVNLVHQRDLLKNSHWGNFQFFRKVRARGYDVSINTYPQSKIHYRVIAGIIGARLRLSHRYHNYSLLDRVLVNRTIDEDYEIHCIENNLRLLTLLGIHPTIPSDCELYFSAADLEFETEFIRVHQLEGRTLIGVHAGSGKTKNLVLKRWPVDHYIELCRRLLGSNPEVVVLLFGGPEEKRDNEAILSALGSPRVLQVPSRTIRQAAGLLRRLQLFLSVDNAFMHLAATVKVPQQVVIESPTFNKTIWPYQRPFRLVPNPLVGGRNLEYYRYDGRDIQGGREHLLACMRSVTPEAVYETIAQVLPMGERS